MSDKKVFTSPNSRSADKFVVRLPDQMRDEIQTRSKGEFMSMNAWIVNELDKSINGTHDISGWIPAVYQLVKVKETDKVYCISDIVFDGDVPKLVLKRDSKDEPLVADITNVVPFIANHTSPNKIFAQGSLDRLCHGEK